MKKKKKEKGLVDLIDFVTEKTLFFIKKIGKMISNKNSHDTMYIFTKIIITLLVLAILKLPFICLEELGTILIYTIGATFRYILSSCWIVILDVSYLMLSFIVLLKVFKTVLKDKELNFIEDNRRKDTKVKNKIFLPIIKIIKICLSLLLIPVVLAVFSIFVVLGMNIALLVNGYTFVSLFLMCIGLLIMISSVILVILNIIKGGNN